jgi:hypothetical protein
MDIVVPNQSLQQRAAVGQPAPFHRAALTSLYPLVLRVNRQSRIDGSSGATRHFPRQLVLRTFATE